MKQEIEQERPLSSPEEEVLLNLARSCDSLNRAFQRSTRRFGITATQYNVLRILRGAQPDGLNCAAIGRRMIAAEPDITRLLNRLKTMRLVRQHRDRQDRRIVWTQISETGLELLTTMEPVMTRVPAELLGHMNAEELGVFNRLLQLARARSTTLEHQDAALGVLPVRDENENPSEAADPAGGSPAAIAP